MRQPSLPAKLRAPRPEMLLPRHQLIAGLACEPAPVLWITAPAGAGKTTLAAAFAHHEGGPVLWYRLDGGDADPAAWFAYLEMAARHLFPAAPPLPWLTAEYSDLRAFTASFFRQLFALWIGNGMVVLDDYHAVDHCDFHALVQVAVSQLPPNLRLVVTSRGEPPPELVRLRVSGDMVVIGRDELLLSEQESVELTCMRLGPGSEAIARVCFERHRGWIAGLILMTEVQDEGVTAEPDTPLVFDFFASEVFARMPSDLQSFLLQTAVLPEMEPSVAAQLTGDTDSAGHLSRLHRRNYFTTRQDNDETCIYVYHPLFRQFLLGLAEERLGRDGLLGIKARAGQVLWERGALDLAADFLREAGDWESLARLMVQHADALLAQGRYRRVIELLEGAPPHIRRRFPLTDYYRAQALLPFDFVAAREVFQCAFEWCRADGDYTHAYLAWCGIIEGYLQEFGDTRGLDPWIEAFLGLQREAPELPDLQVELRVTTAAFSALMYRAPAQAHFTRARERLERLLETGLPPQARVHASIHLLIYYTWVSNGEYAARLAESLVSEAELAALPPYLRLGWATARAAHFWTGGDLARAIDEAEDGLALAAETGVHVWDFMLIVQALWAHVTNGDAARASELLSRARAAFSSGQFIHEFQYRVICFMVAWLRNDHDALVRHADRSYELGVASDTHWAYDFAAIPKALALWVTGHGHEARALLARAREAAKGFNGRAIWMCTLMLDAYFALQTGERERAREFTVEMFALARQFGLDNHAFWNAPTMARLCAFALEEGIDEDAARTWVRRRGLMPHPPPWLTPGWPWHLRIYTLGGFHIERDGEPLEFGLRVQKKPLELLQVVIALGGLNVSSQRVAELLWPEAEGDAAYQALMTNLKRLRDLLGARAALHYHDDKISLDPALCWLDAWTLDQTDPGALDLGALRRLGELYKGSFLPDQFAAEWSTTTRERLVRRHRRAVDVAVERLKGFGQTVEAEAVLERALTVDPCAEELYRSLMQLHLENGSFSAVAGVFERCRAALDKRFCTVPSSATEQMLRRAAGRIGKD